MQGSFGRAAPVGTGPCKAFRSKAFNLHLSSSGEHLFIAIAEHFILGCVYHCSDGQILFTVAEGSTMTVTTFMELYIIIIIFAHFIVY